MLVPMGSPEHLSVPYEILVHGDVGDALAADLGARTFRPSDQRTLLVVDVLDQSHLHGVLERLRDLNVEIVRVNPV